MTPKEAVRLAVEGGEDEVAGLAIFWDWLGSPKEKRALREALDVLAPEERERIADLADQHGTSSAKKLRDSLRDDSLWGAKGDAHAHWLVRFTRRGWEPPRPFGKTKEIVCANTREEAKRKVTDASSRYPITASPTTDPVTFPHRCTRE